MSHPWAFSHLSKDTLVVIAPPTETTTDSLLGVDLTVTRGPVGGSHEIGDCVLDFSFRLKR